jgi:hypothetical protein
LLNYYFLCIRELVFTSIDSGRRVKYCSVDGHLETVGEGGENTECGEDVGDGLLQHIGDNKVFHYHPGGGST